MQVLQVLISVTVDWSDQNVFDVVDACLVIYILLEVFLCIWTISELDLSAG